MLIKLMSIEPYSFLRPRVGYLTIALLLPFSKHF